VGRNTIAGNRLYEPSAVSIVAGGISGMRSFIAKDKGEMGKGVNGKEGKWVKG
jgi:hypothetical protein